MPRETLAVWLDGQPGVAGYLARADDGETGFFYDEDYAAAGGAPLSMSLPIELGEFGDVETRAYFQNLLPENEQFRTIIEREGVAANDVVGQLRLFGADCAGAVSCLPLHAPPVKVPGVLDADYEVIRDEDLVKIVRSLAELRRLPGDVNDPSPVAGVQSKVALTLLPGNRFAFPRHGLRVPTTHILKVPERRHGRDARLEEASALLAAAAGLEVSIPQAIKVGDYDALLIERFDRRVEDGVVSRIHQEDFAQALGLPSELKYERKGRPERRFDVQAILSVLDRTDNPEGARLAFLRATLFNLCIGNTDNHAKNHALLYDRGVAPRFAPLYDLMPIRIDNRFNHQLAFNIGSATHFDASTAADYAAFFAAFGVEDMAAFLHDEIAPLIERLEEGEKSLRGLGLKQFDDLIGRETEALVDRLRMVVAVRERDYFPYQNEGWNAAS